MSNQFLEFEKPLADILEKIAALREASKGDTSLLKEIQSLEDEELKLRKKIFSKLSIWQKVQVARHPQRPHISDFIPRLFSDFDELHGDRQFADDASIIGGLATFENIPVMIVGHEKGRETSEKVKRNFGMAQPEGYRKAKRLFQLAERFSIPVITFIDTAGAYPGVEGEERGQSEAIAQNLAVMSKLRTPIIVVVTGEGGSGGALAIGVGDHVAIFEHAIYSVASPEACASIVWRSSENAPDAAEAMKVSAQELIKIGIVDEIIPEPSGGAHRDYEEMTMSLKKSITDALSRLDQQTIEEMLESRYQRLLRIGS
jgi:acetyl-CoA carboxylase carboxyl transferase subunit alpha